MENNPDDRDIRASDSLQAVVRGGEFHTFSEGEEYGSGCLDQLNIPLGLPANVRTLDECNAIFGRTGVLGGGSFPLSGLDIGQHHFQCMIHPWMRTDVTVRPD